MDVGLMAVEWLAEDLKAESDEMLEEDVKLWLEKAKAHGIDAVIDFMTTNGAKQFGFSYLEYVPQKTLNKLFTGKLKTFQQLEDDIFEESYNSEEHSNYFIICRDIMNNNKGGYTVTIETVMLYE